jgi:hypothetical protein
VHLGTGTVKVTDDGGHTGLVAHGGSKVDGLLGVILGEAVEKAKYQYKSFCAKFFEILENYPRENTNLLTLPRWRAARLRGR